MEKPILATNLDGFLISHDAFIEPHKLWFDRAIALTKNPSFEKWKGTKDYWVGVDEAMKKILPEASEEARIKQAREWFQQDVIKYIRKNPEVINQNLIKVLKKAKNKFQLALITTNTKEYTNQILEAAGLSDIYDIIFASSVSEKPSKALLFRTFVKKYGKPKFYIAARSKEAFEECIKIGSFCIYYAQEEYDEEIDKLAEQTIKSPLELEVILNQE